jgi:glutamine synthetase
VGGAGGVLGDEAAWLVAGLVTRAGALMAFGNRAGNSFVRLSQAKEAPDRVTWGRFNRKALIRIPIVARDDRGRSTMPETVEFRLPDGSAHPHLLLAGIAQAMIAGRAALSPDLLKRTSAESAATAPLVPRAFAQVADALRERRADFEAGGVFPPHVIDRVLALISQAD